MLPNCWGIDGILDVLEIAQRYQKAMCILRYHVKETIEDVFLLIAVRDIIHYEPQCKLQDLQVHATWTTLKFEE